MNLNFNNFVYILLFLGMVSCNSDLNLTNTWEGERLFIDATLNVDGNAGIIISRTFDPILDSNPSNKFILDAEITLYMNSISYSMFSYDTISNTYISDKQILPSACYTLQIETSEKVIKSKEICIPEVGVNIEIDRLEYAEPFFSFEGYLEIENIDAYTLNVSPGFSSNLFMNYNIPLDTQSEESCFFSSTVILDCLETERVNFNVETELYNYVPSSADAFIVYISYISKELADLRNENKYKDGEFEVNGAFNSSFDNDTYGIVGYSYEKSFTFSF